MSNYRLVGCDTDSIKFCHEDFSPMTEEEMENILRLMNEAVPAGIVLEPDGYYESFLVIKSKNYVTVKNGKVQYKGSAVTDQKKEPALREMLEKMIATIIADEKNMKYKLVEIYNHYCVEALQIKNINRWAVKKTVTEAIFKSERLNEIKVLRACNDAVAAGVINGVQEGDKIWLYQALGPLEPVLNKDGSTKTDKKGNIKLEQTNLLKFTELFDAENPDHDGWHYVGRCWNTVNILKKVVDPAIFPKYTLKTNMKLLEDLVGRQ